MAYWDKYENWCSPIVKKYLDLTNKKFVLIDGGAAGGISAPFGVAKNIISNIRFEPHGEDVTNIGKNDIFVDGGLWNKDCKKSLRIANIPTKSSICSPNETFLTI